MKPICPLLLTSIFALGAGARAEIIDRDGILRDDTGNVFTMSQADAVKACAEHGMHLPTARELAKLSQSMGSEGVLETMAVRVRAAPEGYYIVNAKNPDGSQDKFYFNHFGFKRLDNEFGNTYFWSSSASSEYSDRGYVLSGVGGGIYAVSHYYIGAARCAVGR